MSHTPGPWTWKEDDYNDIHFGSMRCRRVDGADGSNILSVVGLTEPDARLITAAPRLLDAAQILLRYIDTNWPNARATRLPVQQLRAAVFEATGEQP